MESKKLMRCGDSMVRILESREGSALVVDCKRQSMPKWILESELEQYGECSEEDLKSVMGETITDYDSLSQEERRFAHERFALIAGVLPFIGDDRMRCSMIRAIADEKTVSKQTIRHYLWRYLVYQDIAELAPKQKTQEKELTQDEKNMRWALNKFFYTRHKNSLSTAYNFMLKEKYCDAAGTLLTEYPSIHQFRYFYKKYNKLQTYYISREGIKAYQRNHRPLLGEVQDFAPTIGVGMLDSTICDIYLVDDAGNLVGRPILTACVDAYSSLCCGYYLSWEGGVYSLRGLLSNAIADKVEWCSRFGISIEREQWDCSALPATLVTDMGTEYKSETFSQLAELGVTVVNLPPFRAELKGVVEKFFDLIQSSYKPYLKGKGVIEPDFQERGARDYRRDACLTMCDFEKIILHCILYYNSRRIIENYPYTREMLDDGVEPYASSIWNWNKKRNGANLIPVDEKTLIMTLLPRTTGTFCRNGLKVNGLRYRHADFTEQYLRGGTATVAYNPDDVSCVWLFEHGNYIEFTMIESRFRGFSMAEVESYSAEKKRALSEKKHINNQAKIELARHIETIASTPAQSSDTNIKQIRRTRKREQSKAHKDYMKGGVQNG